MTDRPDEDLAASEGPLPGLQDLREEPDEHFLRRLRGSINRRLLAADSIDFTLQVLLQTLLGYLDLAVSTLTRAVTSRDKEE